MRSSMPPKDILSFHGIGRKEGRKEGRKQGGTTWIHRERESDAGFQDS